MKNIIPLILSIFYIGFNSCKGDDPGEVKQQQEAFFDVIAVKVTNINNEVPKKGD